MRKLWDSLNCKFPWHYHCCCFLYHIVELWAKKCIKVISSQNYIRLVAAKRIELELKALDESKLNRTIEELCRESPLENVWLKCTHDRIHLILDIWINDQILLFTVILRTEFELQNLLRQFKDTIEPEVNYRPRPGWFCHKITATTKLFLRISVLKDLFFLN